MTKTERVLKKKQKKAERQAKLLLNKKIRKLAIKKLLKTIWAKGFVAAYGFLKKKIMGLPEFLKKKIKEERKMKYLLIFLLIIPVIIIAEQGYSSKINTTLELMNNNLQKQQELYNSNPFAAVSGFITMIVVIIVAAICMSIVIYLFKKKFADNNNDDPASKHEAGAMYQTAIDLMDRNFKQLDTVITKQNATVVHAMSLVEAAVTSNTKMLNRLDDTMNEITKEINYLQGKLNGKG